MPKIAQLIYFIRLLLAVIFWGGIFWCLPTAPPPWPKSAPPRGGTFDLESPAIQKKCPPPPTKKSRGKPCPRKMWNILKEVTQKC